MDLMTKFGILYEFKLILVQIFVFKHSKKKKHSMPEEVLLLNSVSVDLSIVLLQSEGQ